MFAVLGASGNTGRVVVERLLAHGQPVRAIVRDPARVADLAKRGAIIHTTDVSDPEGLASALTGVSAAYVMLPPPYGASDFRAATDAAATSIAKAMVTARVPYVVALSSLGAHLKAGNGAIGSLTNFERELAGTGIARTILRPTYFMTNWGNVLPLAREQGILPSMLQPLDRPVTMVSTDDIGEVAAELLQEPVPDVRTLHLIGPREYSPHDVATAAGRLLGRDVIAVAPPQESWEQILLDAGLTGGYADELATMYAGLNSGRIDLEPGVPARRGKVTLEEALSRLL